MEANTTRLLRQAIEAHKKNDLQDAENKYREILDSQPSHPDANHHLAVLEMSVNKPEKALPRFKIALDVNPRVEQFWLSYLSSLIELKHAKKANHVLQQAKKRGFRSKELNSLQLRLISVAKRDPIYGINPSQEQTDHLLALYQNGRFTEAENLAESMTETFPKYQFAWKILGEVLRRSGKKTEAANAYQKAVALSPEDAEAHSNLGVALQELGKLDEAEASCSRAIALNPLFSGAYYNLGITFQEKGRLNAAENSYKRAIELKPDFAEAHYNLGNTLKELGKLGAAEGSYKQSIELKPDFAEAHSNLGDTLKELGKLDDAEASYLQAIAVKPEYVEAHSNLGNTLKELGKLGAAEASYKRAIELKPDFAEAHRLLALVKTFNEKDQHYLKMLELYHDDDISEEHRCHINFGLAKAYEDLGNFKQAFNHYSEGNKFRKKQVNYDAKEDKEFFSQIKITFSQIEKFALEPDWCSEDPRPVFIVGMPRSGTTLVEQIASSHSRVTGTGELPYLNQFGADIASGSSEVNERSLMNLRSRYLEKLKAVSEKNLIATDKMPQNFRFLGLIAAAFPEAKIIHVKRDAAAVCWANYKRCFVSDIGYSFAIDDILTYYSLYENLMEFWTKKVGPRIFTLDYELLVENQEYETRRLINYLDLDWEEKCLSPQKNTRSVATSSNVQIRKKVYRGSSRQWQKYAPFLDGALDELTKHKAH